MPHLLVIAQENKPQIRLYESLIQNGLVCSVIHYGNEVMEALSSRQYDVLLFELGEQLPDSETQKLIWNLKKERYLPVMALISEEMLSGFDVILDADDFLTSPYSDKELILRINRLLRKANHVNGDEVVTCDGLIIDLAECRVSVEGRPIELTYKEYELLKFLAGNRGRVYTRQALLDQVWGYDYYGGDRTVDVHVRRLRSKIEDSSHSFIETVRNIGYRFRGKVYLPTVKPHKANG